MTDRDISGEIKRSSLNRLPALLGIDGDSLKEVAERVRQFDKAQSDETRQRKALEKVALLIGQSMESSSEKNTRRMLREREVQALELMAVAQAYPHEELRNTLQFDAILYRLGVKTPEPTREENEETRNV